MSKTGLSDCGKQETKEAFHDATLNLIRLFQTQARLADIQTSLYIVLSLLDEESESRAAANRACDAVSAILATTTEKIDEAEKQLETRSRSNSCP